MEASESIQSDDSGQGAEESSGSEEQGFVDSYLNDVPEDYRPHVEPYLRNIERNANERFEQAAQYRKQWEPYENLGLNEHDPEQLEQLLQFAELTQDPEAFQNWWQQVGEQAGYFEGSDDYDDEDDDLEDDELTPESIANIVAQTVDERLQPLQQREAEKTQREQVSEAEQAMTSHLDQMLGGEQLTENAEKTIWKFAYAHADELDDPRAVMQAAVEDYQALIGDIESAVVQRKAGVPSPSEMGMGPANTNADSITNFDDAEKIAKQRLAQLQ